MRRLWLGQYSSEGHLKLKLQILHEEVRDVRDWILMADADELQLYVTKDVRPFLESLDRKGQNWVRGFLQDRVSPTGKLNAVSRACKLTKWHIASFV